jgi:hypothetical protein
MDISRVEDGSGNWNAGPMRSGSNPIPLNSIDADG